MPAGWRNRRWMTRSEPALTLAEGLVWPIPRAGAREHPSSGVGGPPAPRANNLTRIDSWSTPRPARGVPAFTIWRARGSTTRPTFGAPLRRGGEGSRRPASTATRSDVGHHLTLRRVKEVDDLRALRRRDPAHREPSVSARPCLGPAASPPSRPRPEATRRSRPHSTRQPPGPTPPDECRWAPRRPSSARRAPGAGRTPRRARLRWSPRQSSRHDARTQRKDCASSPGSQCGWSAWAARLPPGSLLTPRQTQALSLRARVTV